MVGCTTEKVNRQGKGNQKGEDGRSFYTLMFCSWNTNPFVYTSFQMFWLNNESSQVAEGSALVGISSFPRLKTFSDKYLEGELFHM